MYEKISKIVPRKVLDTFRKELVYSGIEIEHKNFVGFVVLLGFVAGVLIGILLNYFFFIHFAFGFIIGFLGLTGGIYYLLNQASEGKGKFVEKILPDALQLIASNMKSGLTTEKALLVSARPEFGPLEIEFRQASKKIMAGERTEIAFKEMTLKIHSKIFEKTIWLITEGMKSGGEMANLLIQLSNDLREQNALQEEVKGNVSMYVILIFFASMVGAPLMFGISSFIVKIMSKQMASITISEEAIALASSKGGLGISGGMAITPEFILFFSIITLAVISIFGSFTIGIISSSSEKGGIKYIPAMAIGAYIVYFGVMLLLESFFGTII